MQLGAPAVEMLTVTGQLSWLAWWYPHGKNQLKSSFNNVRTFYFSTLQRVWFRPPRQAVWARPNPSWNIWKTLACSWEHAVPAVMKANVSPPAVFTSTPAAADYGPHQTLTHVCEQQLH